MILVDQPELRKLLDDRSTADNEDVLALFVFYLLDFRGVDLVE